MKIVIVEPAGKGGLIHYAWQLSRAMHDAGAEVTLLTDRHYELASLPHPFRLEPALELWDPKPESDASSALARKARRSLRAAQWYRQWYRVGSIVSTLRPDVVQLGDIRFATDLMSIARIRRRAPLLADICHNVHPFGGGHGSSSTFSMSRAETALYRRTYSLFDVVFVHYQSNVARFVESFPGAADRVVPIVHGNEQIFRDLADPAITADSLRQELQLGGNPVVLFFGTLARYKGLDHLLDAFAVVARDVPDAILVVAGYPFSDFDPAAWHSAAVAHGVGDRVRTVARYIDSGAVAAWMNLASVVAFPYRNVYQSGALHVAQTFGVPIVTTAVGAMAEVIRDGETGLVVPPDQPQALAEAITALLRNDALARRLGSQAALDAATRFSWSGVAATMLDRYETLLGGRS